MAGLPRRWLLAGLAAFAAALVLTAPERVAIEQAAAGPLPQATAVSPQSTAVSPQATATSPQAPPMWRPIRFYPVAPPFQAYYDEVEGFRVMGRAISALGSPTGVQSQYFEKARLEDHRATETRPEWQFLYGLLVDELAAVRSLAPLGGDRSNATYDTVSRAAAPANRVPPPAGALTDAAPGAVAILPDGSAFIPFSADLALTPGHTVPGYFWEYINRLDLFPGGWLHDVGLPITEPFAAVVDKGIVVDGAIVRVSDRPITIQAFQRTILTYDPANPAEWRVERANVGTDYYFVFPERVPQ
jgi:hypothetical protein